jgi:hypothetical protein
MRTPQRILTRVAILIAALATFSPLASAYYYWVFFPSNTGPYTPLMARYDLNALKDGTVQFFISNQGPGPLMPGDNTIAMYSQIQQAAAVWNGVGSSSLRLRFGGIATVGLPQNTPGIDVVFDDDMPPGLLAQTKLTFPSDLGFLGAKGTALVPILRARVQLRRDLTAAGYAQTGYSDTFFTTLVHEFGHALGLQHTLTSGVMSTALTRATSKGAPLAADDIAGISLLYPARGYRAATGSITGQVTRSGAGVNLASVVALSTKGVVVSGMSNPDGSYRIDGVPPGQYYVYAHPLPPATLGQTQADGIVAPADPQNDDFSANIGFGTQFFPGTRDWTQATLLGVAAGNSVDNVNFAVTARTGPAVSGMETYGYQDGIPIAAPPLPTTTRNSVVFYATGTTVNNQTAIAPGLGVSVIGNAAAIESGSLLYYTQGFLRMVVDTANVTENLPAALAATVNDDLYVLPAAFTVVPHAPPSITSVSSTTALGQVMTWVEGSNLSAGTRILFDGIPASVSSVSSDGTSASIAEPPALSGYLATVEAVNADGQTSLQALGSAAPAVYSYPLRDAVTIASTPGALIAGTDVMLAISGVNTHFDQERTVAGFGSSDIAVRRAWVVNPQLLLLNVSVDAAARVDVTSLTVSTGLEIVTLPGVVQITPADPTQVSLRVPWINAATGLAGVPAGGTALVNTSGLPVTLDGWTLTIGGEPAAFTAGENGRLTARIPADLAAGPQVVQLLAPGNPPALVVPPVLLQLDAPPPVIQSATDGLAPDGTAVPVSAAAPAKPGDTVVLTVSGLSAPTGVLPPASAVWINIGGATYAATTVTAVPQDPQAAPLDLALVRFTVPANLTLDLTVQPPTVAVMVGTGTRLSAGYLLDMAPPPPPAQ